MSRPMDQHWSARVVRLVVLSHALSHVLALDDDALTASEVRLLIETRDVVDNIRAQVIDHD